MQSNPQAQSDPKEESKVDYEKLDYDLANKQLEAIRAEVESNGPLISEQVPMAWLEEEFKNHAVFLKKIEIVKKTYPIYRKLRRDGSCFYRALIFGIFEHFIVNDDQVHFKEFQKLMIKSKEDLKKVGFEDFVIDDFQQVMLEKLEFCEQKALLLKDLEMMFCDKMVSDSLVMYMRFLTSCSLKANAILYENYIDNGLTVDVFCSKEVEPIDREADQLQIIALLNYLNITVKIIYLDANANKIEPQVMIIPEDKKESDIFISLLYRPGHYDILYKK